MNAALSTVTSLPTSLYDKISEAISDWRQPHNVHITLKDGATFTCPFSSNQPSFRLKGGELATMDFSRPVDDGTGTEEVTVSRLFLLVHWLPEAPVSASLLSWRYISELT